MRVKKYPIARKARLPRRRKSGRAVKIRKADELWRVLIRAKEPSGVCPRCSKRLWTDCMHIFAKGPYPALRHEPANGIVGCRPCHRRIDSDHQAKLDLAVSYLGAERYGQLALMAVARCKTDLDLVLMDLTERVKRMQDKKEV